MLAEGVDSSFEELVGILTDQEPEKGTSTETSSTKTSPRKPSQRQSVIAQIWRKPSFAGGNDGSHTERYPLNALEDNPLKHIYKNLTSPNYGHNFDQNALAMLSAALH